MQSGTDDRTAPALAISALHDEMAQLFPGGAFAGNTTPQQERIILSRSEGGRVQTADGHWLIDFLSGAGSLILGHGHPDVVEAVQVQAATALNLFGAPNEVGTNLAREIVDAVPCAEKIVFATTGSEATAYAMRIARAFTGREKILKFDGGFHGNHDYASISAMSFRSPSFPQGQKDIPGVTGAAAGSMLVAPFNDLKAVEETVKSSKDEIAAVFIEPVQGILEPFDGFLPGLRRICDEYGVPLIFDEVVSGFRLAYGGAQEVYDVTPDIACYGKIVGGGLAVAAVAGRAELMDCCNPANRETPTGTRFGGTLHGNPLGAAAGLATLRQLKSDRFYTDLNDKASAFRRECAAVVGRHGLPALVLGTSSYWSICFAPDKPLNHGDLAAADRVAGRKLEYEMLKNGLFVVPGMRRMFISAAHSEKDLEVALAGIDAACRAVA